ncbi:MAG TPA: YdbH domain-containing protein, partial [Terricaulis sp.]|nr:YdbH domain-containing protein [Terricaulis sp.]
AAETDAPNINFGPELQPYEITELARGVVENVRGPASIAAGAAWTREAMTTSARVQLNGVSLSSATIPVIENVRGEINFDDLIAMTTPPGQEVRVGLLNPGVAVRNGRVRFQLGENGVIAIEQAEFDFAGGVLAMRPEVITLGADETELALYLRDVDASTLISELKVPDLQATGRIEGSFPLRLTRQSAIVSNGVLRAVGGGRIAYTGQAGQATEGLTRVAFDALRDFRYEELALTLNGDLNGEVVSDIQFTGENVGEPIDLSSVAALPGVGRVTMLGVPFRFNVKVTAPFRRLADTAATIIDPGSLINRRTGEPQEPEVDPDAPEQR